jgi:hypothetical protein
VSTILKFHNIDLHNRVSVFCQGVDKLRDVLPGTKQQYNTNNTNNVWRNPLKDPAVALASELRSSYYKRVGHGT